MRDPERLLSGAMNDFGREMLRAWDAEQPSAEAHARTRAIAGLALVAAVASTAGPGATNALAQAGGSMAPKAAAIGGVVGKWLAVVAIGMASAGVTAVLVTPSPHPAPSPAAVHSFDLHEAMRPWPVASAMAPPTDHSAALTPAPVRSDPPATSPSVRSAHALPPARAASLGEQVVLLERVRRAMLDGDPALAERRVDEYEASFPNGSLREEAEALRIDALTARGDATAARRVAMRFLAAYPTSIHMRRFRALIAPAREP